MWFAMVCSLDAKYCVSTSNPCQYAYTKKCCQQAHSLLVETQNLASPD